LSFAFCCDGKYNAPFPFPTWQQSWLAMQFCNSLLLCGRLSVHLRNNNAPWLLLMLIRMIGAIANTTKTRGLPTTIGTQSNNTGSKRKKSIQFAIQGVSESNWILS